MRRGPARRAGAGFTLTELMVVLAICAIMLAAGVPGLRELIARQRLRATANDLFAALDLTRSQAMARGERVIMMPADPLGADWTRGWVVFVDRDGDQRFGAADELIFRQGPVASAIAIRSAWSSSAGPSYIAYNGAGRACRSDNSAAARWGTLSVVLGNSARHIKINMLGRARICDPDKQPRTCGGASDGP